MPKRACQERIRVDLQARTRLRAAHQSRSANLAALMPALLDRAFKEEL